MSCSKLLDADFYQLHNGGASKAEVMKNEILRLSTFDSFPHSKIPISTCHLAKAGFYYSGHNDLVECFKCHIKIQDWSASHDPYKVHLQVSPACDFIKTVASKEPHLFSKIEETQSFQRGLLSNGTAGESSLASVGHQSDSTAANSSRPLQQIAQSFVSGTNFPALSPNSSSMSSLPALSSPMNFSASTTSGQIQTQPTSTQASISRSPQQDLRYERMRLHSFQNWPSNASVRPEDLARCGFYYTGIDDRVQCTFCQGILRNWEPGDEPQSEHRRHFGMCPFLNNPESTGNVPLGQESASRRVNKDDLSQQDYCCGIVTEKAVHARYSLPADRLATYKDFPRNMTQTPEDFTKAGFFYSGISDHVKCFFCDGGLRNFEPNDDPWTEHARWFPRCGYLRLCKGDEYVKEIQDRYDPSKRHKFIPPRFRKAKAKRFPVDEEKLQQILNGSIAQSAVDMGCDLDKIAVVSRRRLEELGGSHYFPNTESLLDAVLEYQEELKYQEVHGRDESEEEMDVEESPHSSLEGAINDDGAQEANEIETNEKKKNKRRKRKSKKKNNNKTENSARLECMNDEDAKALTEDIEKMREERLCKVCLDEDVNTVFLRCGHLVCCSNCAPALRHCPICRELIRGTVRVFLS